jgi:hypothetical protein
MKHPCRRSTIPQGSFRGLIASMVLFANPFGSPFLAYGTDWLAFAHLAIAVVFIGPWINPVRSQWVITFG